jgi:hypothetical protein
MRSKSQGNSGVSVATAPPPSAPDPMPWVALMAGIMALVSTTPFGEQRMGVGGRITSGWQAVAERIPRYRTEAYQDGWRVTYERVPVYRTERYVNGRRTSRSAGRPPSILLEARGGV